jgi:hypothetical protein
MPEVEENGKNRRMGIGGRGGFWGQKNDWGLYETANPHLVDAFYRTQLSFCVAKW